MGSALFVLFGGIAVVVLVAVISTPTSRLGVRARRGRVAAIVCAAFVLLLAGAVLAGLAGDEGGPIVAAMSAAVALAVSVAGTWLVLTDRGRNRPPR
ncbi:hypothetical protein [Herbiconiux sp. L3-i23]|uniref:hypothetical protein n=1 Tax=Herbiconiux sp. L3-i23 TaxID=2905871 RepID=UPI0020611CD3|nr:hypothetical protein [Herbiconiux sp. L3-i23]BDI22827.1 hypothetical protein L3i23_16030 [Herbiconiux sp. L3-i23]